MMVPMANLQDGPQAGLFLVGLGLVLVGAGFWIMRRSAV
jgi:hypothetical protein